MIFCLVASLPTASVAAPEVAAALTLSPPGEPSDALVPGQPLPYIPPLPNMQVQNWRIDTDALELLPLATHPSFIGPPLLRLDYAYTGKPAPAPRLVTERYRKALTKAGWRVDAVPGAPADAVAFYLQRDRFLWLKLHGTAKALQLTLWDPAAHVQPDALREALARDGHVIVRGILFEFNKDQLRPESAAILQQLLALVKGDPTLKLEVQVHTDNSFRSVYARSPSASRAKTIVSWLVQHGADPVRLIARGYGETKPLASNDTAEGRFRNRRVELVKLP